MSSRMGLLIGLAVGAMACSGDGDGDGTGTTGGGLELPEEYVADLGGLAIDGELECNGTETVLTLSGDVDAVVTFEYGRSVSVQSAHLESGGGEVWSGAGFREGWIEALNLDNNGLLAVRFLLHCP